MSRNAIVTLVIGDAYLRAWRRCFEPTWREYAEKHDYDIIAIDTPLDRSERARNRSLHWQKLLILGQEFVGRYDRVVWMDADIAINAKAAPSIVEAAGDGAIGIALYGDLQEPRQDALVRERWVAAHAARHPEMSRRDLESFWTDYFRHYGIDRECTIRFNTGVMVLSPERHRPLLEDIYNRYEADAFDKDQTAINDYLTSTGAYEIIDARYNVDVWTEVLKHYPFLFMDDNEYRDFADNPAFTKLARFCILNIFLASFFLHFPGSRWASFAIHRHRSYTPAPDHRKLARELWLDVSR